MALATILARWYISSRATKYNMVATTSVVFWYIHLLLRFEIAEIITSVLQYNPEHQHGGN
jgi:hypothetical protein